MIFCNLNNKSYIVMCTPNKEILLSVKEDENDYEIWISNNNHKKKQKLNYILEGISNDEKKNPRFDNAGVKSCLTLN